MFILELVTGQYRSSIRFIRLAMAMTAASYVLAGCNGVRPIVHVEQENLGSFEHRDPAPGGEGVVIGAPHGTDELASDKLALLISDRTGAGLVIARGFKAKRLSVAQPLIRTHPSAFWTDGNATRNSSVFKEYRKILRNTANGSLRLYVGIHRYSPRESPDRIEVVTRGITIEEARALKDLYNKTLDRMLPSGHGLRLTLAIEPLDAISWRSEGLSHHGVLLIAEKGLNLRIPTIRGSNEKIYQELISEWLSHSIPFLRENPDELPQVEVQLTDLGKFEVFESRRRLGGVVIGAPHGSYDRYTAEIASRVGHRTGIAAVVATGFTPTEANGWRINVNRPTEKTFPSDGLELHSPRAERIYQIFKKLITDVSGERLRLYIDIHQHATTNRIQLATTGITATEAKTIKRSYREIRDRMLRSQPDVRAAEIMVEPLDSVEIGAWPAKNEGILRLADKSLHFEFPLDPTLTDRSARDAYTRVLASLLDVIVPFLLRGDSLRQAVAR